MKYLQEVFTTLREAGEVLAWIWSILPKEGKRYSLSAMGLMFLAMTLTMTVPYFLTEIGDAVANGNEQKATMQVWYMGIAMLAALTIGYIQNYHREWGWNRNDYGIPMGLLRLSLDKTLGEHRSKKNLGPEQIEIARDKMGHLNYAFLFEGSRATSLIVASLIFIFMSDIRLGWVILVAIFGNLSFFVLTNHYFAIKMRELDVLQRDAQSYVSERWVQMELVKRSGQEDYVLEEAGRRINKFLLPDFNLWGVKMVKVNYGREVLNLAVVLGCLMYVLLTTWNVGLFAAMLVWLLQFYDQLGVIGNVQRHIIANTERVRAVMEVLSPAPDFYRNVGEIYQPNGGMHYELRDLTHCFEEGEAVLKNINLSIKAGERVALIGESGAGKSTIVSLLCRDFDSQEGEVTLDGKPLSKRHLNSVQSFQSCISQDSPTLSGTVRENLLFGLSKEARLKTSDQELIELINTVSPRLMLRFTNGLDEIVGDKGTKLSGGERQRLSIIRALLQKPKAIFIDEATSALDSTTELEVQAGIDRILAEGVTAVMIAHRLSTLRQCTKFVCMAGGQIEAEASTFEELLELSTTARRLYEDQKLGLE